MSSEAARTPAAPALRVLVVDDHRVFAELLATVLDGEPDIECVGHVQDGEHAATAVALLTPDVVLVDVRLAEADGVELACRLLASWPELRVIILSAHHDARLLARAAAAGACGYLTKGGALAEVLSAVRTARPGNMVVDRHLLEGLVGGDRRGSPRHAPVLTSRETQVLQLLAQGLDVGDISRHLGIQQTTCRGYVQKVLTKLQAHSQLQAVVLASELGLITIGSDHHDHPQEHRRATD